MKEKTAGHNRGNDADQVPQGNQCPASLQEQVLWNGSPSTSLLLSTMLYSVESLTAFPAVSPPKFPAQWGQREKQRRP